MPEIKLLLASKSPRRAKILSDLGLAFDVAPTDADEICIHADPKRTVAVNALRKLEVCVKSNPAAAVIAADTVVWYAGRIYGKPADIDEARRFLREFSGHEHSVFTGVAYYVPGHEPQTEVVESRVAFKDLSADDIARYVKAVNPVDRAGAYDIDEHGEMIIKGYTGSYENIMGLPVESVKRMLSLCR